MKTYKFTVETHQEYGCKGFKPSWYPNGEPFGAVAVAHDILEHFPKDNGQAEGELLALGAALFIRGETGYMQRNGNINSAETHLASDFPMLWGYHTDRDKRTSLKPCGLSRNLDLMETCRGIVSKGCENILEEREERIDSATKELLARWLAKGYTMAQRRYKGHDGYTVAYSLFAKIEEQAERLLKHADLGMVLEVRVDFKTLGCGVSCDYPTEGEDL